MNEPDPGGALIPSHIATQAELNEWEHDNLVEGERWAFARHRKDLLNSKFLRRLHHETFGATWKRVGRCGSSYWTLQFNWRPIAIR